MINLNLTILVQVINFLVSYFLIVNILLKPAKAFIFHKIKQVSDLNTEIIHQKNLLQNLEEDKSLRWKDCWEDLNDLRPKVLDKNLLNDINIGLIKKPEAIKLSDQELNALAQELVTNLKAKL